jgi:hypothetical protein
LRADFITDLDKYELILEIRLLAENQQPLGGLRIMLVSICVFCSALHKGICKIVGVLERNPKASRWYRSSHLEAAMQEGNV